MLRLEQEFTIDAPVERVWDFLTDIPVMSQCIPGAESVQVVDDRHVNALVKTRVGPISVAFNCQISILTLDRETFTASAEIAGRDTRLGASVRATMSMVLVPDREVTTVKLTTEVDLSGKLVQYGHGVIQQRANAMLESFSACVREQLTDGASNR